VRSWVVFNRVEVDGTEERVVLVFLAGGGLEVKGNKWSGMRGVVEIVSGFKRAEDGISNIVSPA